MYNTPKHQLNQHTIACSSCHRRQHCCQTTQVCLDPVHLDPPTLLAVGAAPGHQAHLGPSHQQSLVEADHMLASAAATQKFRDDLQPDVLDAGRSPLSSQASYMGTDLHTFVVQYVHSTCAAI